MKKYFKILLILSLVLNLGCNTDEFLDEKPRGREQLDDFFSSEEKSIKFVNSIYQKVNGESWWQVTMYRQINDMATDDNWSGNTLQPRPDITGIAAYNVFPGSTYFVRFW